MVYTLYRCLLKDNQGGKETTVLEYLGLYGTMSDSTNMKDFKRVSLSMC